MFVLGIKIMHMVITSSWHKLLLLLLPCHTAKQAGFLTQAVGAHQLCQLWQLCYHILAVATPVCAGVANQEQLLQVVVCCEAAQAEEACLRDEVDGQIKPLQ